MNLEITTRTDEMDISEKELVWFIQISNIKTPHRNRIQVILSILEIWRSTALLK